MKAISYEQRNGRHRKALCPGAPQGQLCIMNAKDYSTLECFQQSSPVPRCHSSQVSFFPGAALTGGWGHWHQVRDTLSESVRTTVKRMCIVVVVQLLSCVQFFATPWTPAMDSSTPGCPVLHHIPEVTQIHVHWVGDAIQPSHPLLPSSLALTLSQHQDLFQWVGSSLPSGGQSIGALACVFSSVQFSRLVVSDSLWPHEPQHARPPCPSPTPRVHSNPCPLSRSCHPTISSSVTQLVWGALNLQSETWGQISGLASLPIAQKRWSDLLLPPLWCKMLIGVPAL